MLQRITAGFKLPLLTARSWVSLKGVRRHKMFRAKRRAPKAPDARGVRGYAPPENFENLGAFDFSAAF